MSMKINQLEIENVKRIRAVKLKPTANGLTVIGGRNKQGKTSVLDSIAWALGGEAYRPSEAQREGSVVPPNLHVVMNNGLVVDRKGKNSALKVTDPEGRKGGQQLLNEFVEELAINLPKFMESSSKEKAKTLLKIIGVGDKLQALDEQEKELYDKRHAIGQIADQKEKFAKEQPYFPDAPKEPVSASELIKRQQNILAKNGENQRKRDHAAELERKEAMLKEQLANAYARVQEAEKRLEEIKIAYDEACNDKEIAFATAAELEDQSTAELEENIANIDEINRKVRANLDKEKAEEDAAGYRKDYNEITKEIEKVRDERTSLLTTAQLPLPGLSVKDGELTYEGQKWDNISGADRLKVATAIVRKLNPECGFVLLDKLEQFDLETLEDFGAWAEKEELQIIATRVSDGKDGSCSIIIEDGQIAAQNSDLDSGAETETETKAASSTPNTKKWTKGAF